MPARLHARAVFALAVGAFCLIPRGIHAQPRSEFFGVYMGPRKLGWIAMHQQDVTVNGARRVQLRSESALSMELMGTAVRQESTITSLCDATMRPVEQEFRIESNGSVMTLRAQYGPKQVVVEVNAGGGTSKRTRTLPTDGLLAADSTFLSAGAAPRIGAKQVVYYLNPLTITLDRAVVTVEARERVQFDGREHEAYRIVAKTPLGLIRSWEDPPGTMLWAELPLGMVMYRMPEDQARQADAQPPAHSVAAGAGAAAQVVQDTADLAKATAVAVEGPIASPRTLKTLVIELRGLPSGIMPPSDVRQQVTPLSGQPGAYTIRISASASGKSDVALPVRRKDLVPLLADAPYLDIKHSQIRALAARLRDRTSAARTASRIRAWVHRNMQPDYGIGVLRSSVDVLQRKRGVCRDYAILFAALARAAGIPTRLVGGLVYADGKFYYHAWVECWVGRWVAYDATMRGDFVDATHVKLSQGDPTEMMRVYEVIGKLSARIVEPAR